MTRLLTLILITQATAEWVEISQQHYRKPIRTHNPFTTPDKVIHVEDTTKSWTYSNRSVTEYNWNKNPARPTNIGNVKRAQHESTVKTTERFKEEDDLDLHIDFRDYELRRNYGPTRATTELHEHKEKGAIQRVPNLGNIKRVQLNNSPVKSPAVNNKGSRDKYSNNGHENNPHEDNHHTEVNEKHKNNTKALNRRIYINKVNNPHGTEKTATFPPDNDEDTSFDEVTIFNTERSKQDYKNYTTVGNFPTKQPFLTETKDFTSYETQQKRFYKITNSKISTEVTEKNYLTTEIIDIDEKPVTKINTKSSTVKPYTNMNDFKSESHENTVQVSRNDEKPANPMAEDHNTKLEGNKPKQIHQIRNEEIKDKNDETPTSSKTGKNKVNTMENVIKFMRVVADTISRNSRRSFDGKIQYLHELKESILANIEERIEATWPDDDSAGARRRSRSAHASPRGHSHIQFPSSESSLMTISFLTFAVFLIKLVLQVIQTYKHKAMVAPLMVASGRSMFTHHGHH